jgi:hypothetical protein
MSAQPPGSGAKERLLRLLAELNQQTVEPALSTERVIRAVRWERAVRLFAETVSEFAISTGDALIVLLKPPSARRKR